MKIDLFAGIEHHLKQKLPFVAFKLPSENSITAFFQNTTKLYTLEDCKNQLGFVFAPFTIDEKEVVIQPDNILKCRLKNNQKSLGKTNNNILQSVTKNKQQHIDLVNKTITEIKKTNIKKIVVSNKVTCVVNNPNPTEAFNNIVYKYPDAFCYIWFHPAVGLWMGATPETLLQVTGNVVSTMSLAGTQKSEMQFPATWGAKEQEEQQLVTDYIINIINKYCTAVNIQEPKTVKAGSLYHIKTLIQGKLKNNKDAYKLAKALHPTPAVCGLPKQQAYDFICNNENYKRTYYTGFLGVINNSENHNLYVNLRCMQWEKNTVNIYVGGGITAQSNAELEWQETQNKAQTMLSVFL